MASQVECVVQGRDLLGECPLWNEREGALWWVDITGRALRRFHPGRNEVSEIKLPEPMGSFGFRQQRGLVAAMKSGFYFFDEQTGGRELVCQPEKDVPANRLNDGRCDRQGRFWAGSMVDAPPRHRVGALYRLAPGGECTRMREGIVVPNSLAWSPDGRTMYFADSMRGVIWRFDYDPASGTPSNEREFVRFPSNRTGPDGSCVDSDGCLWNAEYGGARVVRYTPEGKVDRVVDLPVAFPTCCAFGGERFDTLYITSASQDLDAAALEKQPLAGGLFAVHTGCTGLPESRFAG